MSKARLEQMKKYLKEAEADPVNNKLYIEDLKLSISHMEGAIDHYEDRYKLHSGFRIDN